MTRLYPPVAERINLEPRFVSSLPCFQKATFIKVGHSSERFQDTKVLNLAVETLNYGSDLHERNLREIWCPGPNG